jgi:hypothetical protein
MPVQLSFDVVWFLIVGAIFGGGLTALALGLNSSPGALLMLAGTAAALATAFLFGLPIMDHLAPSLVGIATAFAIGRAWKLKLTQLLLIIGGAILLQGVLVYLHLHSLF